MTPDPAAIDIDQLHKNCSKSSKVKILYDKQSQKTNDK